MTFPLLRRSGRRSWPSNQSDFDITSRFLGNHEGEGEDMGIRLSLLDNRTGATIAPYKTAEVSTALGPVAGSDIQTRPAPTHQA